jgi:cation:H+ antiporter
MAIMLIAMLLITAGLLVLLLGGEALVAGAQGVSEKLAIPPMIVGLTIVAFATSVPELCVSIIASNEGSPELAIGNILGSNIFNTLMVIGVAVVLTQRARAVTTPGTPLWLEDGNDRISTQSLVLHETLFSRELLWCICATLLVFVFAWTPAGEAVVSLTEGLFLVVIMAGIVFWIVRSAMADPQEVEATDTDVGPVLAALAASTTLAVWAIFDSSSWQHLACVVAIGWCWWTLSRAGSQLETPTLLALLAVGVWVLTIGSDILVDGAQIAATELGVSEAVVGLTGVALGTSAPELATTIVAVRRGQLDMAIGNALGSNLFNILLVLGVAAAIQPIPVSPRFLEIDTPVALGALVALGVFARGWLGGGGRGRLTESHGWVMIAAWFGYLFTM